MLGDVANWTAEDRERDGEDIAPENKSATGTANTAKSPAILRVNAESEWAMSEDQIKGQLDDQYCVTRTDKRARISLMGERSSRGPANLTISTGLLREWLLFAMQSTLWTLLDLDGTTIHTFMVGASLSDIRTDEAHMDFDATCHFFYDGSLSIKYEKIKDNVDSAVGRSDLVGRGQGNVQIGDGFKVTAYHANKFQSHIRSVENIKGVLLSYWR